MGAIVMQILHSSGHINASSSMLSGKSPQDLFDDVMLLSEGEENCFVKLQHSSGINKGDITGKKKSYQRRKTKPWG